MKPQHLEPCGLAMAAALKGYHGIFPLPDKMSQEKVRLLKGLGSR